MTPSSVDLRKTQEAAWAVRAIGRTLSDDMARDDTPEGPVLDERQREGLLAALEIAGTFVDQRIEALLETTSHPEGGEK